MQNLLLFSYIALCSALITSEGFHNRTALYFVGVSFVFLVTAAWQFYRSGTTRVTASFYPALVAALLCTLGFWYLKSTGTEQYAAWYEERARSSIGAALCAVGAGYIIGWRIVWLRRTIFCIAALLPVSLWFLVPKASVPVIDTYGIHQGAAAYVVQGKNPYSVHVGHIAHMYGFGGPTGYVYPPGNLYPLTIAYYVLGDVRYAQAATMTITAVLIWLIARRTIKDPAAELLTLLFLYHPRSIQVLDRSFTETLIIAPFALFLCLKIYGRLPRVAAAAYGYFFSLKQYLIFFPFQWIMIERQPQRLIIGMAGAVATLAPFLIADPKSLINSGFLTPLRLPFRPDSLTVASLMFELYHYSFTATWTLVMGAAATAATFWVFRQHEPLTSYLYATTITMFCIFLFGSQAFIGYYYLVTVLLLLLIAAGSNRDTAEKLQVQQTKLHR